MSSSGFPSSEEKGHSKAWPKTDARHWRTKVFKRTGPDYHARIAFAHRQERFPLKTPNLDEAAAKARDIYKSLLAAGWEDTLAKFKPWNANAPGPDGVLTVGEYIEAARALFPGRPNTFLTYERKFRLLVSQIQGIKSTRRKHDYVNGGHVAFRRDVDTLPLSRVTPEAIAGWKTAYVQRHGTNPLKRDRARTSAISTLRNSKALFSAKLLKALKHLAPRMPSPLPFEGVDIGKPPRVKYKSKVNLPLLCKLANDELREAHPELFKIFLLAVTAGLRRSEIDALLWRQFNWHAKTLILEPHEYGALKTESSNDEVHLGADVAAYFQGAMKEAGTEFVVASAVAVQTGKHWKHYRCAGHFRALTQWLRSKGVDDQKPLHTLRKEFGSLVLARAGLYAASAALRHSNPKVTAAHYSDPKQRFAVDLGDIMEGVA
jgi:integrase